MDLEDLRFVVKRKLQVYQDRITIYPARRWSALACLLTFFFYRMYAKQGYAVIAYLLGLYYVNLIMLYLAPAEDPEDVELKLPFSQNEFALPTRENDEFKGFQRKL